MNGSGASNAVLDADAPSILQSSAGTTQGKPLAGAHIEAMLDEIMPDEARQSLQTAGLARFTYNAPFGAFEMAASQPNGLWHLEITPVAPVVADASAAATVTTDAPIEAVTTPTDGLAPVAPAPVDAATIASMIEPAPVDAATDAPADVVVAPTVEPAPLTPAAAMPTTDAPANVVVAPTVVAQTVDAETVDAPTVAPPPQLSKQTPPTFDASASVVPPAPPMSPDGSAAPSVYPPADGNAFNNDSGQGDASVLPAELKGFNWAALFGSWVWGLGNSVWIALLCLVPCVGFFMRFFLGAKGNEMAWKSKRWESIQAFRSAQMTWGVIGGLVTVGGLLFMAVPAAVLFPVFARARENARRSSCQSNLKQLALAAKQFQVEHNDKFPTGTTMAEWKPQLTPYLGTGSEPLFVCPSHEGARESYVVNPALSGVNEASIQSVAETPLFTESDAGLHLEGSSAAFADGHVKWFRAERARELGKE